MKVHHRVAAIETTWRGAPGWMIVTLFATKAIAVERMKTYAVKLEHQKYRVVMVEVWSTE